MIRISTLRAIERVFLAVLLLVAATEAIAQSDAAGSRDHPLFNRMAGYWIEEYEASEFNSRVFLVKTTGDDWEEKTVEGKKAEITYRIREGAKEPSSLQVVRNYANAVTQAGGKVLYQNNDPGNRLATLLLMKGEREVWVEVRGSDGGGWYTLAIVEKGAMAQEISASDIYEALAKQGRIALYILFDTGKATIKPESQPIVKQVVDMMNAHPDVKVTIEGHTDNVGTPASNKSLSEQRARAVAAAITAQGVAPERLNAVGFGQDKPVASNANDDGRAKNRRVELLKR